MNPLVLATGSIVAVILMIFFGSQDISEAVCPFGAVAFLLVVLFMATVFA